MLRSKAFSIASIHRAGYANCALTQETMPYVPQEALQLCSSALRISGHGQL